MIEDRESVPMCCSTTVAIVQQLQRPVLCPVCRTEYAPDEATARPALLPAAPRTPEVARSTRPGPSPDRRISVAHDPSPSDTGRYQAVRPSELPDAVERTASLLDELQVDLRRPRQSVVDLDVPDGPRSASGADWSQPVVQTSRRWGGVSLASPVPCEDVRDTIAARTGGAGEAYETLVWLRCESGVTGEQLRAKGGTAVLREMLGALGYQFAPAEIRARFDASREALEHGAPIRGRWRIEAAMKAWWRT